MSVTAEQWAQAVEAERQRQAEMLQALINELVVGSDDARVRECEFAELLVAQGQTEHVCGPHDFTHAALNNGPRPALKTATGELLKHYGTRTVDFRCQGEELRVGFTVVDVKRPILSVPKLVDRGIEIFIQAGASRLCTDSTVRLLNSHVVVVVSSFCNDKLLFRCCWHL